MLTLLVKPFVYLYIECVVLHLEYTKIEVSHTVTSIFQKSRNCRSCILQIIWCFNHLHQSRIIYLNPLWNSDSMGNVFLTTLPAKFKLNIDSELGPNSSITPAPDPSLVFLSHHCIQWHCWKLFSWVLHRSKNQVTAALLSFFSYGLTLGPLFLFTRKPTQCSFGG